MGQTQDTLGRNVPQHTQFSNYSKPVIKIKIFKKAPEGRKNASPTKNKDRNDSRSRVRNSAGEKAQIHVFKVLTGKENSYLLNKGKIKTSSKRKS